MPMTVDPLRGDTALELGEGVALPADFEPRHSEPAPLDTPRDGVFDVDSWIPCTASEAWRGVLGPAVLAVALVGAFVSCVFGGR